MPLDKDMFVGKVFLTKWMDFLRHPAVKCGGDRRGSTLNYVNHKKRARAQATDANNRIDVDRLQKTSQTN
uniref:Uncharacterized protein n=1 Tax=Syphacia muris TaxID=451379 RepID=A0A0N5ASF1_9BILA